MSKGPSGLGLSKKTLIPKILQYSAEKMRKNLQKRPKMTKFEKNGLYNNGRSSAEYDHVFLLEVDSEPAGRGLNAKRFLLTCDVVAFYDFFQKTEIFQIFFFCFWIFSRTGGPIFKIFFLGEASCQRSSLKPLCPQILTTVCECRPFTYFLKKVQFFFICKMANLFKLGGSFFLKNFLV